MCQGAKLPYMAQSKQETSRLAIATFVEHLKFLREQTGLSQAGLEKKMKEQGTDLSQKSISHIETFEVDPGFSNLSGIAASFGVPLWVMIVPGLDKDMLQGEKLKRLVRLVEDYMACDDTNRAHVENLAAAYADLKRSK